jgi:hypothetical protein
MQTMPQAHAYNNEPPLQAEVAEVVVATVPARTFLAQHVLQPTVTSSPAVVAEAMAPGSFPETG